MRLTAGRHEAFASLSLSLPREQKAVYRQVVA
jgi:hypothetical protein